MVQKNFCLLYTSGSKHHQSADSQECVLMAAIFVGTQRARSLLYVSHRTLLVLSLIHIFTTIQFKNPSGNVIEEVTVVRHSNNRTFISVSYTHLDVYKRQAQTLSHIVIYGFCKRIYFQEKIYLSFYQNILERGSCPSSRLYSKHKEASTRTSSWC